jgi:hypothetical protein
MAGTMARGGTTGTAGGGGGGAAGTINTGMVVWYKFDETSGTAAADSSGNNRNGTVTLVGGGTSTFSTTHQVGTRAISLNGTSATVGAYVNVPASLNAMGATTAITIACWVNVTTARNWARVWDFNNTSTTGYMFLTTQEQTGGLVRFAITQTNNGGEQMLTSASALGTSARRTPARFTSTAGLPARTRR